MKLLRFYISKQFFFLAFLLSSTRPTLASHILGGELSWTCQGNGTYVFDLVVYRDCNGFDVSNTTETIKVWNHNSITQITMNFLQRTDMSPFCQPVLSSPQPFQCGSGTGGGNGVGAVERVVYRSNPTALPGNPPPAGWIFTYSSFFRSNDLTNLATPNTVGITVVAKMFNTGANGTCNDSSPKFYEPPFVVTCTNSPYTFNPNAYDPDLDSLAFVFGPPLDQIVQSYNPPADPVNLNFNPGFSFTSPTPNASMGAGNSPAQLNSENGSLSFTSSIPGNFAVRTLVLAYRNGVLISENQLEYQVAVENCLLANAPPAVIPPFNGATSFETTVTAGDLVAFNLSATDNGLLHNGQAQSTYIYASGAQFAQNITNAASGCANPPCATLSAPTPIIGSPGASVNFSWQTTCNHLLGATGLTQQSVPYTFVFRVQDNLCQIPAVQYVTVTVNVQNVSMPTPPDLYCVSINQNNDVVLNWTPSLDPGNNFAGYEIRNLENGLIQTINNIATSTFTHAGSNASNQSLQYYVLAKGGCDGLFSVSSDTISTIHLNLSNPNNGTAVLNWTGIPTQPGLGNYSYIEMEYPAGTWNVVDSVLIGTTNYTHEVKICAADLNFRVFVKNSACNFYSNEVGDFFEDQTPPQIPLISSVSYDTISGNLIITWNVNPSTDTYGYVIYDQDNNGFYIEMDTVWGINNNSYTILNFDPNSAVSFTVAAFDSCFTDQFPPTYQTSGKAEIHTTMYLSSNIDICSELILLNWTPYTGWSSGVAFYRVFYKPDNGNWVFHGNVNGTNTSLNLTPGQHYTIVVEAVSENGFTAFSNAIDANFELPGAPDIHYLSNATVDWNGLFIKYYSSFLPGQGSIVLLKYNPLKNIYEDLETRVVMNSFETFSDPNHQADKRSEIYRFMAIDSCGNPTITTNIGKTIFLETEVDNAALLVKLNWSAYEDFFAPILKYNIYRSVNGILDTQPLASVPHNRRTFVDTVEQFIATSGQFCYYVQAVEGYNEYGFFEMSNSNYACALIEPLIYIPNTIIINGINELFKPVVGYYKIETYELTIMNRWGQMIFRTNNPEEGWNGSHGGKVVPEGTYVYILRINNGESTEITKRGHVNVLID